MSNIVIVKAGTVLVTEHGEAVCTLIRDHDGRAALPLEAVTLHKEFASDNEALMAVAHALMVHVRMMRLG